MRPPSQTLTNLGSEIEHAVHWEHFEDLESIGPHGTEWWGRRSGVLAPAVSFNPHCLIAVRGHRAHNACIYATSLGVGGFVGGRLNDDDRQDYPSL